MTVTEKDKKIYGFNIMAEAKMRTLVLMTKRVHPDWSDSKIKEFLSGLLGYAIEKELKQK